MSTYTSLTRHPITGKYSFAQWKDDYFGAHRYGVKFEEDPVVYPADQVHAAQLKEFWAEDVLKAVKVYSGLTREGTPEERVLKFLELLNKEYKARWKRDPVDGEGAVKNERLKYGE